MVGKWWGSGGEVVGKCGNVDCRRRGCCCRVVVAILMVENMLLEFG